MNRLGILIVVFLLLNVVPVSRGASDNIIEIRQYFELRDTISLMNLEMKRALAPGSNSSLLSEPDGNKQLSDFIGFIESRIDSFAQSDTPLKYHYLKKLNNLFVEAKQLHAALLPKLKAASSSSVAAMNNTVKVVPAPKEQATQLKPTDKKVRPKPFFDSIGMRTLAPASSSVRFIRPDLVKTPVAIQPAVSERQNVPALLVPSSAAKPVDKSNAASMTGSVKPKKITRPANEAIERAKADLSRPPIPITPVKPVIKNESVIASEPVKMTEAKKIPEPAAFIGSGPVKTLAIVEPLNPVKPTDKVELVEPLKIVDTVQIASMAEPVKALQASGSEDPGKVAVTASASKVLATAEKPAPVVPAGTGVMRPLAIMIENHNQSRPQSGLDQADVVYEMPVEGGITRFMGVYTRLPGLLGPVRSCREYFIDRALEVNALYVHCGGSPLGYAYISKRKINSIDEIAHGKPFFRDKTRKAPHNLYSKGAGLYDYMSEKISMRLATQPVLLNYGKRALNVASDPVLSAKIRYHGNYSLEIKYEDGAYQRYMNEVLHVDRETKKPLRASAVIIQVAAMKTVDAVGRQEISFIGSGTAWILEKGQRTKVTWHKDSPGALTSFKDAEGIDYLFPAELQIWVQVVSPTHKLFFNGQEEKPAAVAGKPEIASPSTEIGKQG